MICPSTKKECVELCTSNHECKNFPYRKEVENLIRAWESLEGDRNYSPREIGAWLKEEMSPAINILRAKLKEVDKSINKFRKDNE